MRTNKDKVEDILVDHYDGVTSLTPFIQTASSLVDKVARNDVESAHSSSDLELIERWLAAHFYAHADQLMQSESKGRASGSYQGQTAMIFMSTQYGQTALGLDTTGYLAKLQKQAQEGRQSASVVWLGTRYRGDESERSSDQ